MNTNLFSYFVNRYGGTYHVPHEIRKHSKKYTFSLLLWFIVSMVLLTGIVYAYMLFSTIPLASTTIIGKPNSFYVLIIVMVLLTILFIVSVFVVYSKYNEFTWARYLYATSIKINTNKLSAEEILLLFKRSNIMELLLDSTANVTYDITIGEKSKLMSILDLSVIDVHKKYSIEGISMLNDILLHYTFMQSRGINRRGVIEAFIEDILQSQQNMIDDTDYLVNLIEEEYGKEARVEKIVSIKEPYRLTKEDFINIFYYSFGLSSRIFQINKQKQTHTTLNVLQENLLTYISFVSTLNNSNIGQINEKAFNEIINVNKDLISTTNNYLTLIKHDEGNISKIDAIVTSMEELTSCIDELYQKNVLVTE